MGLQLVRSDNRSFTKTLVILNASNFRRKIYLVVQLPFRCISCSKKIIRFILMLLYRLGSEMEKHHDEIFS